MVKGIAEVFKLCIAEVGEGNCVQELETKTNVIYVM